MQYPVAVVPHLNPINAPSVASDFDKLVGVTSNRSEYALQIRQVNDHPFLEYFEQSCVPRLVKSGALSLATAKWVRWQLRVYIGILAHENQVELDRDLENSAFEALRLNPTQFLSNPMPADLRQFERTVTAVLVRASEEAVGVSLLHARSADETLAYRLSYSLRVAYKCLNEDGLTATDPINLRMTKLCPVEKLRHPLSAYVEARLALARENGHRRTRATDLTILATFNRYIDFCFGQLWDLEHERAELEKLLAQPSAYLKATEHGKSSTSALVLRSELQLDAYLEQVRQVKGRGVEESARCALKIIYQVLFDIGLTDYDPKCLSKRSGASIPRLPRPPSFVRRLPLYYRPDFKHSKINHVALARGFPWMAGYELAMNARATVVDQLVGVGCGEAQGYLSLQQVYALRRSDLRLVDNEVKVARINGGVRKLELPKGCIEACRSYEAAVLSCPPLAKIWETCGERAPYLIGLEYGTMVPYRDIVVSKRMSRKMRIEMEKLQLRDGVMEGIMRLIGVGYGDLTQTVFPPIIDEQGSILGILGGNRKIIDVTTKPDLLRRLILYLGMEHGFECKPLELGRGQSNSLMFII